MSWVPAPEEPVDPGDLAAFAAMFDKHAEHVYDYCRELLGDTEDAAEATEAALIAARSVLQNPEQLRAWLFALARDEVLSRNPEQAEEYGNLAPPEAHGAEDGDLAGDAASPARSGGPAAELEPAGTAALASPDGHGGEPRDDADPVNDSADTDQFAVADMANAGAGSASAGVGEVRAPTIVSDLSGREREVLDLVYRHGIRPDHLPAVLGVPPEHALALLSAAEEDFQAAEIRDGAAVEAAAEMGLEQIAAVPLAPLPPSVRRRTFQAVFGVEPRPYAAEPEYGDEEAPRRGYGEPADAAFGPGPGREPMDRARKRLRVAAIVVVPAAAIAGVGFYLSGSPLHQVGNAALNPPASTGSPTGSSGPAAQTRASRPDPKPAKSKSTSIAAFFPKSPHTVAPPVTDPTQPPVPTPSSTSPTAVITQPPKRHHHPKPSPSSSTVTISPSSPPPSTGTPTPPPTTPPPTPSASASASGTAPAGDSPSPAPTSALFSSPAQFFVFPAVIAAPSRGTSPKPTSA
jgi:DNA-directed RNA polymerase specialized sigma24 family protein